jgi:rod shape-determining protein MreC
VRSAVDALDQDKRTRGVVVGKGSDICEMKYISHDADIRVGSPVISSGLGGVFPKGLLIGKVSKVEETQKGLFRNVVVTPSAKISFLEEVFVLK